MSRTNHKTMRITDEALEYIEKFSGKTFNDKINNMIDYFMTSQKSFESDLRFFENEILKKKQLLQDLSDETSLLSIKMFNINNKFKELLK